MRIHHQTIAFCLVLLSSWASTSFGTSSLAKKQPASLINRKFQNEGSSPLDVLQDKAQPPQLHKLPTKSTATPVIKFQSPAQAVPWGLLLTTLAGFSNGAFMSGFLKLLPKQGVAAVTGAWTNSAIGLASQNMKLFYGQASILVSFILGSTIYGLLNPNPKSLELDRKTTSTTLTLIGGCLMAAIWILDHAHNKDRATAFEVCCLAAVASGIQNSLTSSITGNLCRTTHFTGISSDIGTFLGQVLRGNKTNLFKLQTFSKLALCFWMGGIASFFMTRQWGADAILVPAVLNLILAFYTQFVHAC